MWTITEDWVHLSIKATTYTTPSFSEEDAGADIVGWSVDALGTTLPVVGGGSVVDRSGWAQIDTRDPSSNGGLKFIPVDTTYRIHYNNNYLIGGQIPDQYTAESDANHVATVRAARLKEGFEFRYWSTTANDAAGSHHYLAEDLISLSADSMSALMTNYGTRGKILHLYAIGEFTGTYNIALSFIKSDGKRYFLTHPGSQTPRFARTRYIDDWTNAWQGMSDAYNSDDHYLNTFSLQRPDKDHADEYTLNPRRETLHGYVDSLVFYKDFAPATNEYLGLGHNHR